MMKPPRFSRTHLLALAGIISAPFLTGCVSVAHCPCTDTPPGLFKEMVAGQETWENPPTAKGRTIYVFRPKNGFQQARPILLLHEYPTFSAPCFTFGQHLADQGFTVYVPILFGNRTGDSSYTASLATLFEVGFSPQWHVIVGEHMHSTITDWLRKLVRDIYVRENHHRLG